MEEKIKRLEFLIKKEKDARVLRRIQCVFLKMKLKINSKEIASIVGYNAGYVRTIQAEYWKEGESVFELEKMGGRYHANMTIEEENEILNKFKKEAEKGHIVEISRIKKAYEKKLGRKIYSSVIYQMLDRQGWRKITPRPRHPKNNEKKMKSFKKTSNH